MYVQWLIVHSKINVFSYLLLRFFRHVVEQWPSYTGVLWMEFFTQEYQVPSWQLMMATVS